MKRPEFDGMKHQKENYMERSEQRSIISAVIFMLLLLAGIFVFYKPVYYINDDWIIRDILSGRYSGSQDAHVYNIVYPFACIFCMLYKFIPQIDWWGGYLFISMIACLGIILKRIWEKNTSKILSTLMVLAAFLIVSFYPTLVFSMTTTGTMLAIAGIFLLLTDNEIGNWKRKITPMVLLILSFCTRRDTFYMVFPYATVWFLSGLFNEERKEILKECFIFTIILLCSIFILFESHIIVFHSDPEWMDYLDFRSLRIRVHDYTKYPDYEKNRDFYEDLGLSKEEYDIVRQGQVNTAFDVSPDIRTVLREVGDFGEQKRSNNDFRISRLYTNIRSYINSISKSHRYMSSSAVVLLIFSLVSSLLYRDMKKFVMFVTTILIIMIELGYLSIKGRYTPAVGNSLVMMTVWLLTAICLINGKIYDKLLRLNTGLTLITVIIILTFFGNSIKAISSSVRSQNNTDRIRRQIDNYCVSHYENHYFEPAFSISGVSYSLNNISNRFNNLIVLGGWNYSSPEYEKIMHAYGLSGCKEIEKAIVTKENFFIISNERLMDSIIRYLQWKYGESLKISITDRVANYANVYSFELQ